MYIPKLYREKDRGEILAFLQQNEFATLVSFDGEKPVASHLLVEVVDKGEKIHVMGHMSRANPLWRTLDGTREVLVIFQGPHTYISASWYNHVNVPTWNYQSVHLYGIPRLVTEHAEMYSLLKRLMDRHESGRHYNMDTLPQDFVEKEMQGIMAFDVEITKVEANYKLSQNRNNEDYQNIVYHLEQREDDLSHDVADAMKRQRPL